MNLEYAQIWKLISLLFQGQPGRVIRGPYIFLVCKVGPIIWAPLLRLSIRLLGLVYTISWHVWYWKIFCYQCRSMGEREWCWERINRGTVYTIPSHRRHLTVRQTGFVPVVCLFYSWPSQSIKDRQISHNYTTPRMLWNFISVSILFTLYLPLIWQVSIVQLFELSIILFTHKGPVTFVDN